MLQLIHNLQKHPLASILNLIGLSVALTACYILATQVQFAENYNKSIPEWENVYRIEANVSFDESGPTLYLPRPVAEELPSIPVVESVCALGWSEHNMQISIGEKVFNADINCTTQAACHPFTKKV